MNRNKIATAWKQHCATGWPQFSSPHQGQLMTIDTVISGCVVFYLDTAEGLDAQRVAIVKDCLGDLDELTEILDSESKIYFFRLRELGAMLLGDEPRS
ncbi:MAG: hypothetical protein E8D52_08615 [Nitrospira sp.]|nr:MAG: hypothetical protein E8D52_08615 [Nitrospira sp.]